METGEEDTRQPQMIISLICATILIYCTTLYIDAASIHDHTVIWFLEIIIHMIC